MRHLRFLFVLSFVVSLHSHTVFRQILTLFLSLCILRSVVLVFRTNNTILGHAACPTWARCFLNRGKLLAPLGHDSCYIFLTNSGGCDMSKSRLISRLNIYFLPLGDGENSFKSYQFIILPSLIHPLGFYLVLLHSVI